VAAGQLDSAAVGAKTLAASPAAQAMRVIWTSPSLPRDPIIWRRDLDPAIKEKLRQFFLTYGQDVGPVAAAQRANLARIGIGGFDPADNGHLLPAREMEATRVWLDAKAGGDKAKIDAAWRALAAITAQRQDLEARTRAPAAAQ
jgi:phosphonate transport system substrate-binding protein